MVVEKKYRYVKVVINFSTFDLLHAKRENILEEAKRQCNYFIVELHLDSSIDCHEKNAPSQSIIERYIQLKEFKHVDEIYLLNAPRYIGHSTQLFNTRLASWFINIEIKIHIYIVSSKNKNLDLLQLERSPIFLDRVNK